MVKLKSSFVRIALTAAVLAVVTSVGAYAAAKKSGSEVVVRRVDSNNLIRLRVYIDGKNAGSLKVGETSTYKIKNGDHTIYVGFEDYQARSTEVSQFTAFDERFIFSITDTSIVLVRQEQIAGASVPVVQHVDSVAAAAPEETAVQDENFTSSAEIQAYVGTVQEAFNVATKSVKKGAKITIINVESDVLAEGDFVLEELTYMAVHSPKKFVVIDRRKVEAYRAANHQPLTRYENDYLISLGELLGASYVMTGRLNGEGQFRRLRIRVLDVKTGILVGSASSPL
ncbi:MAG: hypothetical protein LBC53_00605 [Spirochaetaceae bacterium]|jgi:hypothetical protein|nr:hypothetical protein [Spirochaetaceae bacterium]